MRDTKLYESLPGPEKPWSVERVELDVDAGRVHARAGHPRGQKWPRPECDERLGVRDHPREGSWRHLGPYPFQTYPHARVPQVDCPTHRAPRMEMPRAQARARSTALMEAWSLIYFYCDGLDLHPSHHRWSFRNRSPSLAARRVE